MSAIHEPSEIHGAALTVDAAASLNRRSLLTSALGGAAALTSAGTLGYIFRPGIEQVQASLAIASAPFPQAITSEGSAKAIAPHREPTFSERMEQAFREEAHKINERHRLQTVETVAILKRKYENPVFGRLRVWDLIEKLATCIDITDSGLYGASQWLHVQQVLAAMEFRGVEDPDLFLIAMVHDLGKLFLNTGEVPENVVCRADRLGEYLPGVGLDQIVYQFGHGELIYSRIKDHVPEHVAWTARYHTIDLLDAGEYMNECELAWNDKYMVPFREFDASYKSPFWVPSIDMNRYRDLIEKTFPEPILF